MLMSGLYSQGQGCSVPDRDGLCRLVVWPCRTVPGCPGLPGPWAGPAPNPSLLSIGPGPAQPPSLHFHRQGLGRRGAPTTRFYWPDPSLLLGRPLTSISQFPLFYLPDQAAPCQIVSDRVRPRRQPCRTVPCQCGPCRPDAGTPLYWLLPVAHCASVMRRYENRVKLLSHALRLCAASLRSETM